MQKIKTNNFHQIDISLSSWNDDLYSTVCFRKEAVFVEVVSFSLNCMSVTKKLTPPPPHFALPPPFLAKLFRGLHFHQFWKSWPLPPPVPPSPPIYKVGAGFRSNYVLHPNSLVSWFVEHKIYSLYVSAKINSVSHIKSRNHFSKWLNSPQNSPQDPKHKIGCGTK